MPLLLARIDDRFIHGQVTVGWCRKLEHDHIVPHESASALLGAVSSAVAERLHYDGGHIGSVISARSRTL